MTTRQAMLDVTIAGGVLLGGGMEANQQIVRERDDS